MNKFNVECLPDETFLHSFGIFRKFITHHPGRDRVGNFLSKNAQCVGLIDEDPGSARHAYFKNFSPVNPQHTLSVLISKNISDGNILITLKPRMEEFLYRLVRVSSVNPTDFGFPENEKRWHDFLTLQKNQVKLEKLLSHLHSLSIPEFNQIRGVLK